MQQTKVIFRKYKTQPNEIIALFPDTTNYSIHGQGYINSYMHVGQHGLADLHYVMSLTTPATTDEYTPLLQELLSIGYEHIKPVFC